MAGLLFEIELDNVEGVVRYRPKNTVGEWKSFPIYDVAATTFNNSIAGHTESQKAVEESLPFKLKTLPNYLLEGGSSIAVSKAVFDIVGEEVEWFIDPERFRVSYENMSAGGTKTVWTSSSRGATEHDTIEQAVVESCKIENKGASKGAYALGDGSFVSNCTGGSAGLLSSREVSEQTQTTEHIPIDDIAAQVVTSALAGHPESKVAVGVTLPFDMPREPVDGVTVYPLTIVNKTPLDQVTVSVVPLTIVNK